MSAQDLESSDIYLSVNRWSQGFSQVIEAYIASHVCRTKLPVFMHVSSLPVGVCYASPGKSRAPQSTEGRSTSATGEPLGTSLMLVVLPIIILRCLDSEGESRNVPQRARTDPWLCEAGLPTCPDCKQRGRQSARNSVSHYAGLMQTLGVRQGVESARPISMLANSKAAAVDAMSRQLGRLLVL